MNKSYVIRAGHFTEAQKKAYESLSSKFIIPFNEEKLDFQKVFENRHGVTMEIGFGMGIATAEIAQANPQKNYLGIEVHRPGVGRLLWEIEKRNLTNIRIIEYDAAAVVEKMLPENSFDAIHVFFPDPWPKKRHHKRRLIKRPFTQSLAACLKPQGCFYMTTDWEDYAKSALEELVATPLLRNAYDNFAPPQEWRPVTKFEQKGVVRGHIIREICFIKSTEINF